MKALVARVADFDPGDRVIVEVANRSIGVFRMGGEYFAVRNLCPHAGGPVCLGRIQSDVESDKPGEVRCIDGKYLLECPWHGWEYDLATGQSVVASGRLRVRPYVVSVRSVSQDEPTTVPQEARHFDGAWKGRPVPGPYILETFPVSIEDDYIVIEVPDQQTPTTISRSNTAGRE